MVGSVLIRESKIGQGRKGEREKGRKGEEEKGRKGEEEKGGDERTKRRRVDF
jgi:hypothetical protein